jgi:hypothetical protein
MLLFGSPFTGGAAAYAAAAGTAEPIGIAILTGSAIAGVLVGLYDVANH